METDDSILASDDLEFLRDLFRQNDDYVETLNTIRSTKLTNRTLKQLHYASMTVRNNSEKQVRTQLHLMSEPRKTFMEQRKTREEADVSAYWKPIWNFIDEMERSYRNIIGSLLLTFDIDEEIIKKLATALEDGYRKGDWKEQVKEEDREAIKKMGVEFHTLCEAAGVRPEDIIERKMKETEELRKKIALLELDEKDRKREWFMGLLDETAEKEGGGPFTATQVRDLIPGTATDIDKAVKELVNRGKWTMEKKGKTIHYMRKMSEEAENHVGETVSEE